MKSVLLLYPHQLYQVSDLPKVDTIILVEEPLYFGMDQEHPMRLHKQKLILHRASMRRYVEEVLWPAGFKTEYIELDVLMSSGDVLDKVTKAEQLYVIDPSDNVLTKRLLQARREREDLPNLTFLSNPNFYLKEHEVRQYFTEHKSPEFLDFYQWQRERFNILIDQDYKPFGGQWTHEGPEHKKLPADVVLPSFGVFGDNKHVQEAVKWVEEHFPDNPGSSEFIWPTDHAEAKAWLDDFLTHRIDDFATYEHTIDPRSPWLYHSLLASSLNTGLLKPQEVVAAALERHNKQPVPLASLEGFIRQILGWREFTRGQYLSASPHPQNDFNHHRKLTSAWYNGSTGIPPLDDLIKKLLEHAYSHQAEQRLIAANLMILSEIQPEQIYRWFHELSIDSFDWSLVPQIYGMQLFASGSNDGPLAIAPCDAVLEVSNYDRDVWSDIWDGLYWRFIEKHQTALGKDRHFRVAVGQLAKLDPDRKRIIHYRAEDFLTQHTVI